MLGGTELAILNRESGDSNRAIPRSRLNIDRVRVGLAILSRFSATYFAATPRLFVLLAAEILAIPGLRFRDSRDS